jgi:hypothetical protein
MTVSARQLSPFLYHPRLENLKRFTEIYPNHTDTESTALFFPPRRNPRKAPLLLFTAGEGLFFIILLVEFSYIAGDLEKTQMEKMDSAQRRKSGINLPASMSESSLRLDAISSGSSVRLVTNLPSPLTMSPRTISNLSSPSSKSGSCSDRFIPCRSSSRLHTFGLVEKASPVKEGGNEAYSRLLKSELFGTDFGFSSPAGKGSPMSPNKNMLRFKTEHSGPNSPFSPSILGQDSGLAAEVSTPPKPPRKVPKTPHKV